MHWLASLLSDSECGGSLGLAGPHISSGRIELISKCCDYTSSGIFLIDLQRRASLLFSVTHVPLVEVISYKNADDSLISLTSSFNKYLLASRHCDRHWREGDQKPYGTYSLVILLVIFIIA